MCVRILVDVELTFRLRMVEWFQEGSCLISEVEASVHLMLETRISCSLRSAIHSTEVQSSH